MQDGAVAILTSPNKRGLGQRHTLLTNVTNDYGGTHPVEFSCLMMDFLVRERVCLLTQRVPISFCSVHPLQRAVAHTLWHRTPLRRPESAKAISTCPFCELRN